MTQGRNKIGRAIVVLAWLGVSAAAQAQPLPLRHLAQVARVSDRYQSYNIEMAEVTGGRFWAPYGGPPGERYRQRPPIDLTNPRLVALARHLGPAFVRVSGTWANNAYVVAPGETVTTPPAGFAQVLQRAQWHNVVAFAKAVDARIVTSFAVSNGTRDAQGHWQPAQAQRLLDLTREAGGRLAAAEFFNEPNIPTIAQAMPATYTAEDYARDFRVFRAWARRAAPDLLILGPGGVSEASLKEPSTPAHPGPIRATIHSADLMSALPGGYDAVSYHFYGAVSQRCGGEGQTETSKDAALSDGWLDKTLVDEQFYAGLRDRYAPGKLIWNTETAQSACGGSPWASTFLDTFRYLNQLGALAQQNVQVVMHNTLAASDYALIDGDTLTPRPSYWGAVLWRRLMGPVVLASPRVPGLRVYAQCLRGGRGGVALLALNTGDAAQTLSPGVGARAWLITAATVDAREIAVNGVTPRVAADGTIANLSGVAVTGALQVPARSIAFVAVPGAGNQACR